MEIAYERVLRDEGSAFATFLASETWPFHSGGKVDVVAVARRVTDGEYDSPSVRTFWIVVDGKRCGFVRLFDLDDGGPLFDLRIASGYRGTGIGKATVTWLTRYLFELLPAINRVEGTTRADNQAMRALFASCGFAKEAHYRDTWPGADGVLHDAVGYSILRRDWLSGTTTPVDWNDDGAQ